MSGTLTYHVGQQPGPFQWRFGSGGWAEVQLHARTPLPGASSSPEDKLDGYEKARAALAAGTHNDVSFGSGLFF